MEPQAGKVDAARVDVYVDDAGEHRWRARDTNGEIVADSGEGYVHPADAWMAAKDLFPNANIAYEEVES